jgi:hypothetical protein
VNHEDLTQHLLATPFQPFRVVLTDGQSYDVKHPDFVLTTRRTAVIGVKKSDEQPFFDRYHVVSLLHIVRLEPVEAPAAGGSNGPA